MAVALQYLTHDENKGVTKIAGRRIRRWRHCGAISNPTSEVRQEHWRAG